MGSHRRLCCNTDWMRGALNYHALQETYTVLCSYTFNDTTNGGVSVVKDRLITVNVTSTDVPSGDYIFVQDITSGETPPAGLAAQILSAVSPLRYEGQIVLEE